MFSAEVCTAPSSNKIGLELEQRYVIKFCVKLDKNGMKTLEMLRWRGDEIKLNFQVAQEVQESSRIFSDNDNSGYLSTPQTDNSVQKECQVLDKGRRFKV
ncbi:hypothetical protein TNCV_1097451 [Trichonephila clavipes]|nr:hypothetical protein TNCV_1097451 [Trichonephila clavipes]